MFTEEKVFPDVVVNHLDPRGMIPPDVEVSQDIPWELFTPALRIGRIVLPTVKVVRMEDIAAPNGNDTEIRIRQMADEGMKAGFNEEMLALLCRPDVPTPLFALGTIWPNGPDPLHSQVLCGARAA